MIYFTSDTHVGHHNIIKYCNRPFFSVDEMNSKLIANWNSIVSKDDIVYHLGDFGFGSHEKMLPIFNSLNGIKHLIKGNHDSGAIKRLSWESIHTNLIISINGKKVYLSHHPNDEVGNVEFDLYFHGHTHNGLLPTKTKIDVGVDAWNFLPTTFFQIDEKLNAIND
jgi:calcineurin-like phosphoesterase family protein